MLGFGKNPEYVKKFQKDIYQIGLILRPIDRAPDLFQLGDLRVTHWELHAKNAYQITLCLLKSKTLVGLKSANLTIEGKTIHFLPANEPDYWIAQFQAFKSDQNAYRSSGELCLSLLKERSYGTQFLNFHYKYAFSFELVVDPLQGGADPGLSVRPVVKSLSRTASPPLRNPEENSPPRLLKKPALDEAGNILAEIKRLGIEVSKIQAQGGAGILSIQEVKTRLDGMEMKITGIHESICYEGETKLKAYMISLQRIFQEQAQKKIDQANQELKALDSTSVLRIMDEILSLVDPSSSLYQRFMAIGSQPENELEQLAQTIRDYRKRMIPNIQIEIPQFEYKNFAQFLRSDYQQYLSKTLSIDREHDVESADPAMIYRKCAWRACKKNLDDFNPVFRFNIDVKDIKVDWDTFLFNQFLLGLRNIEQVESRLGGNPTVGQLVDDIFSALLAPLDLELLPVQIGECFDPRKHDKDPHRSGNTSNTVSRVLSRGIQYKNQDAIWAQAKVSIG